MASSVACTINPHSLLECGGQLTLATSSAVSARVIAPQKYQFGFSEMKRLLYFLLVILLASTGFSTPNDQTPIRLNFSHVPLEDVLHFYSFITRRKVWVSLGMHAAAVSVDHPDELPLVEAVKFIRTTLLEQHGIELRDSDSGETFVSWSDDPKYEARAIASGKPDGKPVRRRALATTPVPLLQTTPPLPPPR
jgi:hypothetical protein